MRISTRSRAEGWRESCGLPRRNCKIRANSMQREPLEQLGGTALTRPTPASFYRDHRSFSAPPRCPLGATLEMLTVASR